MTNKQKCELLLTDDSSAKIFRKKGSCWVMNLKILSHGKADLYKPWNQISETLVLYFWEKCDEYSTWLSCVYWCKCSVNRKLLSDESVIASHCMADGLRNGRTDWQTDGGITVYPHFFFKRVMYIRRSVYKSIPRELTWYNGIHVHSHRD